MSLMVQIQSIFLSFIFGIVFSILYNFLYYVLHTKYWFVDLITNLFFSLMMFGIYFILLNYVNNGVIHIYFLLTMGISFIIYCKITVKLRVKWLKRSLN